MNATLHPIFRRILAPMSAGTLELCPLCHKEKGECDCNDGYCRSCKGVTRGEWDGAHHTCPMCGTILRDPGEYPDAERSDFEGFERARLNDETARVCNRESARY